MPIINSIADSLDEISACRREMHENPQTAYEEEFAAGMVKKKLTEWGIPFKDGIAVTGIVATIEGQSTGSGKAIGLRADMDALDITEKTGLPHASKNENKMHACGHDGHTATLLAAAKYLNNNRNFDGKVHLIFQPGEEGARGAVKMIEEGLFRDFPCDYVFGLHNWPYAPLGEIATRTGPLLAAVDEFDITITAKGGHAAMPHVTNDPAVIATQVFTALQTVVSRNIDPIDTAVLSVTNMNIGTGAFNIIGDTAKINGTVRTFKKETSAQIEERMREIIDGIAKAFGAAIEMEFKNCIDPTINTEDGVTMAAEAAALIVGEDKVSTDMPPVMGGEDFGAFLQECPGAFIALGQGSGNPDSPHDQGLHSPYYDFNDDMIPVGASYFAALVEKYMPLDK